MIATVLDQRMVRVALGAVGVPVTAAAVVGAFYSALFIVGGVWNGQLLTAGFGGIGVLGLLGLAGAWRRVLHPHTLMSARERVVVRALLTCGIASGLALAAWGFHEAWIAAGLLFGALAMAGVALFRGTPVAV